jgi:hypothetical protein
MAIINMGFAIHLTAAIIGASTKNHCGVLVETFDEGSVRGLQC